MRLATQLECPDTRHGAYPMWYATEFQANDGTRFEIRPIRPDDELLMVDFHRHLSEKTVYYRYFSPLKLDTRVAHERLAKRCLVDYHNEIALIALCLDASGQQHLAAVARLIKVQERNSAEVAFVVADQYQHHGLGTYLLARIIKIARREGFAELEAVVLADNANMKDLFRRAGFKFSLPEAGELTVRLTLR